MKKTKKIALTAILAALYFVLSVLLKIPIAGHITLDMGYIALMVGAVFLGAVPGALIGGIGVLVESALMSSRGVSPGWILMNLIVGALCGWILSRTFRQDKKRFLISAFIAVPLSVLLGAAVKMFVDCLLYRYAATLADSVKIKLGPTAAAWIADSAVMLAIGLPVSLALKKKIHL